MPGVQKQILGKEKMKLLHKIKKKFADISFNKKLGFKAKIKDIEVRSYQEEMKNQLEKRAVAKGKQNALKHIRVWWRRCKFILLSKEMGK